MEESFKGRVCVGRHLCETLRVARGFLAITLFNVRMSGLWILSQGAADFFWPSSRQTCSILGTVPHLPGSEAGDDTL